MRDFSNLPVLQNLGRRPVFFDGAMGTTLQQNGLAAGELPETWNLSHPELIRSIHRDYLDAGCEILKTNTFGANRLKFPEEQLEAVIAAAVSHAREAVSQCGHPALVAMDIGPTGKLLKPMGDLDFEEAVSAFGQAAALGEKNGADLILIETMSDTLEAKAAVLGAKEHTSLPVFVTMIFDETGKLLTGGDIPAAVAMLEGLGADAIGLNCGLGPKQMLGLLPKLAECASVPIIVNPNAGLPRRENGQTVYDVGPEEFAGLMAGIVQGGAWIIGGCCGTTPAHLRETVSRCQGLSPLPLEPKNRTVVSSYAKAVAFGEKPVIIGERINPTGKKRFKQALREHDMDYILREGVTQQQNGAHVLDVNVGLPEIDEKALMCQAVTQLQGISDLPLQIDTSSPEVMEAALRLYNGKALVNSVNGKEESMHAIFPLVKKYGGVVIALTLDENGIPETAQGRLAIAEKIVETAAGYGISKKDIVVDALAMTISTGAQAAAVTLETLRLLRDQLGVHTSLGVSNVSFGLPQRENINAAFFTMALQNGLGAAIINPNSQAMLRAYDAFCALSGADPQCAAYIEKYAQATAVSPIPAKTEVSLSQAIIRGLKESAYEAAKAELAHREPLHVINEEMVPALDVVGQGFEKGTLFLPQLLMSAEAAKAAFEAVREALESAGSRPEKKGKIVIATVQGDIHDIGKNIVKVLLENYSYDVIDLGKDVPPETVVEAVVRDHVQLAGLSALMTTTVENMAKTIEALHREAPWCKVMVGGAVLTPEYAEMIHADHYAKDAMGSVRYAEKIFGSDTE